MSVKDEPKLNDISLRDWFAGQALAGYASQPSLSENAEDMAEWAYQDADAMMKAREEATR